MSYINDNEQLLARLILAMQGETGLRKISIEGLVEALDAATTRFTRLPEWLPVSAADVMASLEKLAATGWVVLDMSNPHVSVTAPGLLTCGPIPIPRDIADAFGERFDESVLK